MKNAVLLPGHLRQGGAAAWQEHDQRVRQRRAQRSVRLHRDGREAVSHVSATTTPKVGEGEGGRSPRLIRGGRPPSRDLGQLHHPATDRRGRARDRDQHDHVRDLLPDPAARRRDPRVDGGALRRAVAQPGPAARRRASPLGFYDPISVQYWDWLKGVLTGRDVTTRCRDRTLPGALPGLLLHQPAQPVLPEIETAVPGDVLARGRRGDHLGGHGGLHRRAVGAEAGLGLRPVRDDRRPRRRLAADLLDRPGLAGVLQLQPRLDTTGGVVHAHHREPARVGARPAAAVDHAGAAVLRAVRTTDPRRHARDHGRGLHPHGAGQGAARADRGGQARPALGADPDRDDLRPRLRPAHRWCGAHRDRLRPARPRPAGHQVHPGRTTCRRCSRSC